MQKLLLGMPALERDEGSALYDALTLLGAQVQRRGLRRKVSKDKASLAFLALRTLQMSWLLTYERIVQALFHSRWSLGYESG